MDLLTFDKENRDRIQAVESSFGPAGAPLSKPGRVLMGQGRLMKQGRRKPQPKDFFLFNDVMVYGSVILNGRWHKNQKIIPLEGVKLEDMEDSERLSNQWLIRTPCKSFFVSASSYEEKRAWMEHIDKCQSDLLRGDSSLQADSSLSGPDFAVAWIPDHATFKCMRCFNKFTTTNRRHHCRKCGFVVCSACSARRVLIRHIHPTKPLRVCGLCDAKDKEDELSGPRKNSAEDNEAASSDEDERVEMVQSHKYSSWLVSRNGTGGQMGTYVYPRPMNQRPQQDV